MKFAAGVAAVGAMASTANAFQPAMPIASFGQSMGGQMTSTRPVQIQSRSSMTMLFGFGGGRSGFKSGGGSFGGKNIFGGGKSGSGKTSGGNNNGNNINGGGNGGGGPVGPLYSSTSGDSNNPLTSLWIAYNSLLDSNPLITKALTSFIGFALGDILAQRFIEKKSKADGSANWDYKRSLKFAMFGFLLHGPIGHYFYGFLDAQIPGQQLLTVATKVAIDQLLWNPIFGSIFFSYLAITDGENFEGVKARVRNNLWTAVRGSWVVWPVAHFINFKFVPSSQRLLYINCIQVAYNMFLSVISQKA